MWLDSISRISYLLRVNMVMLSQKFEFFLNLAIVVKVCGAAFSTLGYLYHPLDHKYRNKISGSKPIEAKFFWPIQSYWCTVHALYLSKFFGVTAFVWIGQVVMLQQAVLWKSWSIAGTVGNAIFHSASLDDETCEFAGCMNGGLRLRYSNAMLEYLTVCATHYILYECLVQHFVCGSLRSSVTFKISCCLLKLTTSCSHKMTKMVLIILHFSSPSPSILLSYCSYWAVSLKTELR